MSFQFLPNLRRSLARGLASSILYAGILTIAPAGRTDDPPKKPETAPAAVPPTTPPQPTDPTTPPTTPPTDNAAAKDAKPPVAEVDGTREAMKDPEDSEDEPTAPPGRKGKGEEDVVGPGETRRIAAGESVDKLVVMLGKATVDGRVLGDLVVVGGRVTVNGTVDGTITCTGGRVTLGPKAVVRGDVAGFGTLIKKRGAMIAGKEALKKTPTIHEALGRKPKEIIESMGPQTRLFMTDHVFKARPLSLNLVWPWIVLFAIGAVHVLTLLLFPGTIARTARLVGARPVTTLLLGFVSLPLFLVLAVVISGVTGCLGTPFLILALILGLVIGKVAIELKLGDRLLALFRRSTGSHGDLNSGSAGGLNADSPDLGSIWTAFALGAVLLVIGYLVPYLGFGLWTLASLWGLGAALLLLFSRRSSGSPPVAASAGNAPLAATYSMPVAVASATAAKFGAEPTAPFTTPGIQTVEALPPVSPAVETPPSLSTISVPAAEVISPAGTVAGGEPPASATPAADPQFTRPPTPLPTGPTGPTPLPSGASALERELWALPRVGLGIRLIALTIDALVYGLLIAILPGWLERIRFADVILAVAYFAGFWVWKGASIGGLLMGIRVIRLDGRVIDWQVAVIRSLASFLSLFSAGLGEFWCAWDNDQQTWQDKLAGTVVVKEEYKRTLV